MLPRDFTASKLCFLGNTEAQFLCKLDTFEQVSQHLRFLVAQFNVFFWKLFHLRIRANEYWIKITKKIKHYKSGFCSYAEYHWQGGSSRLCHGRTTFPSVWHRPSATTDGTSREGKGWLITPKSQKPQVSSTLTSPDSSLTLKMVAFLVRFDYPRVQGRKWANLDPSEAERVMLNP